MTRLLLCNSNIDRNRCMTKGRLQKKIQPQCKLKLDFANIMDLGQNVSFSRSREEDLIDKLDGLISVPQEWHKGKVS